MIEAQISNSATIHETTRILGAGRLSVGEFVTIEPLVTIDLGSAGGSVILHNRAKLKQGAVLATYDGQIVIGKRVSIGEYSVIYGHGGVIIDEASIVASHCHLGASRHIFEGDVEIRFQGEETSGIRLHEDSWLGSHVAVHDGVEIGPRSIIGSGSVVTRRVPPDMIAFGAPCRPSRARNAFIRNQVTD